MKTNRLLPLLVLFVMAVACKQETDNTAEEKNPLAHALPTMIDVVGEYKGDMPCDNCDKEIVTVKFLMDKTAFKSVARVNGDGSTAGVGTWELNGDKVTVDVNGTDTYIMKGKELQKTVGNKTYSLKKTEK